MVAALVLRTGCSHNLLMLVADRRVNITSLRGYSIVTSCRHGPLVDTLTMGYPSTFPSVRSMNALLFFLFNLLQSWTMMLLKGWVLMVGRLLLIVFLLRSHSFNLFFSIKSLCISSFSLLLYLSYFSWMLVLSLMLSTWIFFLPFHVFELRFLCLTDFLLCSCSDKVVCASCLLSF